MSTLDAAVYRRAAAVIRKYGLAKGAFIDHADQHCTVGAVMAALASPSNLCFPALADLCSYTQMLRDMLAEGVTAWNDRLETTEADVVTLLEQAAEKLEAER